MIDNIYLIYQYWFAVSKKKIQKKKSNQIHKLFMDDNCIL
jgi:hypothetical protein